MNKPISKRAFIRIISFSLIAVILMLSAAAIGYNMVQKYKSSVENTYKNALNRLSDHLTDLANTLTKGMYVKSESAKNKIYTKLAVSAQEAKDALSLLPVTLSDEQIIQKYLSQISDIAQYLQNKSMSFDSINDSDEEMLNSLRNYSKQLAASVEDTAYFYTNYGGDIMLSLVPQGNLSENITEGFTLDGTFRNISSEFTNYPTLIYDGPFSDHILHKTAEMSKNQREYTINEARYLGAVFLNIDENELKFANETLNNTPLYCFTTKDGTTNISICKQGGFIESFHKTVTHGDSVYDYDSALKKAQAYLKQKKFDNMKSSYGYISDSVATFNFSYVQDDVVCYTDLIKVGVAVDTGEIVSFGATGYIMNHKTRKLDKNTITLGQAKENVSDLLTIKEENTALIPTDGENEVLCYEFLCDGENDDKVLVYINAATGEEENIYILLKDENGTLTI